MILSDHLKPDCCVDIIGAEHVTFDLIVHFGEACFTETIRDNIYYVLPYENFNI